MENSKQFLRDNKIVERISFKDGKKHKVVLLKDKIDKITDAQGNVKEGVKYMVIEDGEPRTFFTSSISLIQKLANLPENSEVIIEMKSKKDENGNWKSYFDVKTDETEPNVHTEEDDPFENFESSQQE